MNSWYNADKTVPVPGSYVLVYTKKRHCYTAVYMGYWWLFETGAQSYDVTHWMPLPDPPEDAASQDWLNITCAQAAGAETAGRAGGTPEKTTEGSAEESAEETLAREFTLYFKP